MSSQYGFYSFYKMIDQAISQICDIFASMCVTNVLQTQPYTHTDHSPEVGGGIIPWGCGGEASRATATNNLTGSWRGAVRSSNEARCHNDDGTLDLTIHPPEFL